MSEFSGTPLAAGTILGLRNWNVDSLGRLRGVSQDDVWRPGENVARCTVRDKIESYAAFGAEVAAPDECPCGCGMRRQDAPHLSKDHYVASPDCTCGFYAYHDGSSHSSNGVVGMVEAWGKVTIGTRGFRAEKARILALVIPNVSGVTTARICRIYPGVETFPDLDALLEAHPLPLDYVPSPETDPDFWTRDLEQPKTLGSWAPGGLKFGTTTFGQSFNVYPTRTGGKPIGHMTPGGIISAPSTTVYFGPTSPPNPKPGDVWARTTTYVESWKQAMRLALDSLNRKPRPSTESRAGHQWQASSWTRSKVRMPDGGYLPASSWDAAVEWSE